MLSPVRVKSKNDLEVFSSDNDKELKHPKTNLWKVGVQLKDLIKDHFIGL